VSWLEYVTSVKNQGPTNTCYLNVWATQSEIMMTKYLRGITEDEWEDWIKDMTKRMKGSEKDEAKSFLENYMLFRKKRCVTDAYYRAIWDIVEENKKYDDIIDELKKLPTQPRTRQDGLPKFEAWSFCFIDEEDL